MYWYRAKTILIIFFICMNVFLLVNLMYTTNKSNIVTPEIISSTVDILSRNGIKISPEIIPAKTSSLKTAEMTNAITDKDVFAQYMCGDDIRSVSEDSFEGKNGNLSMHGDKFIFVPSSQWSFKAYSETIETEFLTNAGVDFSDSIKEEITSGDKKIIRYINTINGYKIFDSYIKITVNSSSNDVETIEGVWFNKTGRLGSTIALKSVTGVLIDFILTPGRTQGDTSVTSLELGYTSSDDDIYHQSTVLLPVWNITLNDGTSYCIDTREQ